MRSRSVSPFTRAARLALCALFAAPFGHAADPPAWPVPQGGAFHLTSDGGPITLVLDHGGRTLTAVLAPATVFVLPLGGQARLRDPWVSLAQFRKAQPLADQGWSLWDGRPVEVHASASGTVRTVGADPALGPFVEIDHGSHLLTRYAMGRYGKSAVAPGTRVSAGDVVGVLGKGLPDDIPFVRFSVFLEVEAGRVALDPAPFLFASAANRVQPIATGVLNAAVRAGDADRVARLLALGLDPNRTAADDTCPLEWALLMHNPAMARQLVAAGADPGARTAAHTGYYMEGTGLTIVNTGPTVREYAEELGDPDLIEAVGGKIPPAQD